MIFAVKLGVAPVNGAYDPGMIPAFNWTFIKSVISHYQLPFWSIVLISIGGQAVGMRFRPGFIRIYFRIKIRMIFQISLVFSLTISYN